MFKKICSFIFVLISLWVNLAQASASLSIRHWWNEEDDSPVAYAPHSLWSSLVAHFQLPVNPQQPQIANQIAWIKAHPFYFDKVYERAVPYLGYIYGQIKARHMPAELALLPIIESAYDPFVYSPAGAAGLWQLMPKTGDKSGLHRSWWKDDRRNIRLSTAVALNYLEYLYHFFNENWLLAIAAYDSGEGTVLNAIHYNRRHRRGTRFWDLPLPRETKQYVPRLLAFSYIIAHSEDFKALQLPFIPNSPYFSSVPIKGPIALDLVAKLAHASTDEIYRLNPEFNRWATDPSELHHLLIPKPLVSTFERNMALLPKEHRVHWLHHQVKPHETLSHISRHYGIPEILIRQVNHLSINSRLKPGQTLRIPRASRILPSDIHWNRTYRLPYHHTKLPQPVIHRYVIREGDSLWKIARHFDIHVNQLVDWNHLKPQQPLRSGKILLIYKRSVHRKPSHGSHR